jgi:hypothetical protein
MWVKDKTSACYDSRIFLMIYQQQFKIKIVTINASVIG